MRRLLPLTLLLWMLMNVPIALAGDPPPDKSNRIAYRRLTWDDFRVDDNTSGLSAQTHTFTSFAFKSKVVGHSGAYTATAYQLTFDGGFDKGSSWRRSYVTENGELLLAHEQGHFDIEELKLRQLRRWKIADLPQGFSTTPEDAHKDLKKRLDALYQAEVDDMKKIQRRYDAETDHGTRREIQLAWTEKLNKALTLLPPIK